VGNICPAGHERVKRGRFVELGVKGMYCSDASGSIIVSCCVRMRWCVCVCMCVCVYVCMYEGVASE
jgi:hypothetical protein